MNFKPLSEIEESIAKNIVDAAFTVHKKLGPGLLKNLFTLLDNCFCKSQYCDRFVVISKRFLN